MSILINDKQRTNNMRCFSFSIEGNFIQQTHGRREVYHEQILLLLLFRIKDLIITRYMKSMFRVYSQTNSWKITLRVLHRQWQMTFQSIDQMLVELFVHEFSSKVLHLSKINKFKNNIHSIQLIITSSFVLIWLYQIIRINIFSTQCTYLPFHSL